MTTSRPIEVRLKEYADAMRQSATGMLDGAELIEAKYGKKAANTGGLRDGARLYSLVADDIDKILEGEELRAFVVEGEV